MTASYLFLHGLAGEPENWSETAAILRSKGMTCHIPRIDFLAEAYTPIDDLAAKLLEHYQLNMPAIVVGNSYGCHLALASGHHFSRIVLTAPHNRTQVGRITRNRERFDRELKLLFYDPSKLSAELKDHYWSMWKGFISSPTNFMRLREIKKAADSYNLEAKYKAYQDKITLVAGRQDQFAPVSFFSSLIERHHGMDLHILEECGHAVPIEKPKELADILIQEAVRLANT